MDVALKTKWIAALRSGDFKQGTATLAQIDNGVREYCCLGVLAAIAEIPFPVGRELSGEHLETANLVYKKIRRLIDNTDDYALGEHTTALIVMNDHHGKSFNDIADYIEGAL